MNEVHDGRKGQKGGEQGLLWGGGHRGGVSGAVVDVGARAKRTYICAYGGARDRASGELAPANYCDPEAPSATLPMESAKMRPLTRPSRQVPCKLPSPSLSIRPRARVLIDVFVDRRQTCRRRGGPCACVHSYRYLGRNLGLLQRQKNVRAVQISLRLLFLGSHDRVFLIACRSCRS